MVSNNLANEKRSLKQFTDLSTLFVELNRYQTIDLLSGKESSSLRKSYARVSIWKRTLFLEEIQLLTNVN